ncbi:MAG: hypothetical protein JNK05_13605 [Myxococcales bacterium]|nr:hypothetical protein [Myxococcales bacterium]
MEVRCLTVSTMAERWRALPLSSHSTVGFAVSPNGARMALVTVRYDANNKASTSLRVGALDANLAWVEERCFELGDKTIVGVSIDDDGRVYGGAGGKLVRCDLDGTIHEGPTPGWSLLGVTAVPFEQTSSELRLGVSASVVSSRDRRWLAANNLRNVVSVVFATDGFVEHKVLPKLATVSDFSRDGSLAAIRSKTSIELRDTTTWKKLLSIPHSEVQYALFSPDQSQIALLRDRAPCLAIHRVSDGSLLGELDQWATIRAPVWVSDRLIVHSTGILVLSE